MSQSLRSADLGEFFEINTEDVSHERLDGETIVISLTDGRYYSFSGPAADVWWLIQEGYTSTGMIQALAEVFQLPSTDLRELGINKFINQALDRNLIRRTDRRVTAGHRLPNDYRRDEWTPPSFIEFSDLKDLILVDPIHDTTALGWPMIRDE